MALKELSKNFMKSRKPGNRLTIKRTITDNEGDSPQSYPVIVAEIVHPRRQETGGERPFATSC